MKLRHTLTETKGNAMSHDRVCFFLMHVVRQYVGNKLGLPLQNTNLVIFLQIVKKILGLSVF
jgi:hypothetical protein